MWLTSTADMHDWHTVADNLINIFFYNSLLENLAKPGVTPEKQAD